MTVGERIAQKRKELGLSQEALGERMGVSRQSIYKWESDAALRIDPETLEQIEGLRLGLFRDRKLVAWYEQLDGKPANYGGDWENTLFFRLNEEQTMEPGHGYCQAVVVVDRYGRERIYSGFPVEYDPEENFAGHAVISTADAEYYYPRGMEPAGWDY